MKSTWNRIVQALGRRTGRPATPEPLAAGGELPQHTPPDDAPFAAPLPRAAERTRHGAVDRLNWAFLLPTARTVRWLAAPNT